MQVSFDVQEQEFSELDLNLWLTASCEGLGAEEKDHNRDDNVVSGKCLPVAERQLGEVD